MQLQVFRDLRQSELSQATIQDNEATKDTRRLVWPTVALCMQKGAFENRGKFVTIAFGWHASASV